LSPGKLNLSRQSNGVWVDIFSQEIQKAQALDAPDRGDTYFSHWCSALERLCVERGLTDFQTHQAQLALWRQAILNTPHGVPLALENAYHSADSEAHAHGHHHHHAALDPHHLPPNLLQPVAVVKPRLA
jgi:hypothetical protein